MFVWFGPEGVKSTGTEEVSPGIIAGEQIPDLTGKFPRKTRIGPAKRGVMLQITLPDQILGGTQTAHRQRDNREFSARETGKNRHIREITGNGPPASGRSPFSASDTVRLDLDAKMAADAVDFRLNARRTRVRVGLPATGEAP